MNRNITLGLCLTAAISLGSPGTQAQQDGQSAVSIVFTDLERMATVDTVIPAGHDALHALLGSYDLSPRDVLFVHMDESPAQWVTQERTRSETVLVETGDGASAGTPQRVVKIVKVNDVESDLDGLSEEEREQITKELEKLPRDGDTKEQTVIEKKIVIKTDDTDMDESVRIERTVVNGKEEVKAYVNGNEVSREEAEAMMKKHDEMVTAEQMQHETVFVSEDEQVKGNKAAITCAVHGESGSGKKAVVIVKSMETAATPTTPGGMEGALSLYPNPAGKEVTVHFEGDIQGSYMLSLSDLAGQKVWEEKDNASGTLRKKINLDGLAPGTYILNLSHDRGMRSQKLVIE